MEYLRINSTYVVMLLFDWRSRRSSFWIGSSSGQWDEQREGDLYWDGLRFLYEAIPTFAFTICDCQRIILI